MKKIVFTLIVLTFLANVSAQIKVNSSGNVGIGKDPQFTGQTEIKYFVAQGVKEAYICIFDMQGKMLQKLNATAGQNSVIINGSTLQAGIYLYALVANGKEVDTKRIILTK